VFDLFTQAERPLDRAQGGLGVGLTLVKLLIEMHGGSVEARNAVPQLAPRLPSGVTSKPVASASALEPASTSAAESVSASAFEHGAEFIVRLPAKVAGLAQSTSARASAGQAQSVAPAADRPLRILVVDDNVDAADSIALLLGIDGFEARSVHGALAALDIAGSFKPDVVLLDIGLPVLDGYEVAQRLRVRGPGQPMRIVALSGYGQQADRVKAAQAGFDDYLVKPVEPTVLSEYLRSLH
jgi:CheY-like chemotaxis protein